MKSSPAVLLQWVQQHLNDPSITLQPLCGDASHRRYYRLQKSGNSLIVVDASAELNEILAFTTIAHSFRQRGLQVPTIYAQNSTRGYLLLSDLGDTLLLQQLSTDNVDYYYRQAYTDLLVMQQIEKTIDYRLPYYDMVLIQKEWEVFTHWFLVQYKKVTLASQATVLHEVFTLLLTTMQTQPQVFIHRDYHSRNLMAVVGQRLGILDFQGACWGPITYDLVSLLKDCYIDWSSTRVQQWALTMYPQLWQQAGLAPVNEQQFLRYFDFTGLQRHLKVLGQFARKALVEQDESYLQDMPRVQRYVLEVCDRYAELHNFKQLLLRLGF